MNNDPIGDSLKALKAVAINERNVYAEGAVLDATVPTWRLQAVGPQAIKAKYRRNLVDSPAPLPVACGHGSPGPRREEKA